MTAILKKIEAVSVLGVESDVSGLRQEREDIAWRSLRKIWRRKWLVAATVVVANMATVGWLLVAEPRYTSTATVEFGFGTVPTMAVGTEGHGVDANSVVESAARILRSRNIAAAASDALKLDEDPEFAHASRLERALATLRTLLDLSSWQARAGAAFATGADLRGQDSAPKATRRAPSPRELAVNELMRRVTVTHESRTFVITVAATSGTPEQSALIANAVARQYLRQERRLMFETERNQADHEIETLTAKLGVAHPSVLGAKDRLRALVDGYESSRAPAARDGDDAFVAGRLVHFADPLDLPSSPDPKLALQAASALGLLAGLGLAMAGGRRPAAVARARPIARGRVQRPGARSKGITGAPGDDPGAPACGAHADLAEPARAHSA